MSRYNTITDYSTSANHGFVTINPFAIVAVYRYQYPVTFSRANPHATVYQLDKATQLRKSPFIITNDIIQLQTSSTKENHVTSMQMVLRNGANYLSEILPGDHVFVFLFQDETSFEATLKKIKNNEPCNRFLDGLKFWGKVGSCRKSIKQSPQGKRQTIFTANAAGFTELDASIYYEAKLAGASIGEISSWLHKTGVEINNLIGKDSQGGIAINEVIPSLFQALLGAGVPKNQSVNVSAFDTTAGLDTSTSFLIPGSVAGVFGINSDRVKVTDIYQLIHGIQNYTGNKNINDNSSINFNADTENSSGPDTKRGGVFAPDGIYPSSPKIAFTGTDQLGTFLFQVPAFNGQKSAWSILTQFLNPTINEIYTTLRADANGFIVPTLVCRQKPFSSGIVGNTLPPSELSRVQHTEPPQSKSVNFTRMGELPRWIIHPVLMTGFDVGRSDALRFNFIQIAGTDGQTTTDGTAQLIRNPPIKDEVDMARNGLRPYFETVNCASKDIHEQHGTMVSTWQYILADILMGQHLTLTGSLTTHGIIQPICVGDNLEIDQTLFHIESVNHTYSDDGQGHKAFYSSFTLTHGVNAAQWSGDDSSIYVGIRPEELTTYDSAIDQMSTILQPEAGDGFHDFQDDTNPLNRISDVPDEQEIKGDKMFVKKDF